MRAGARSAPVALALLLGACTLHACNLGDVAAPRVDATGTAVVVVPPRDFVSGSRLRARYHVVEGVVEVLAGWHDVILDADCAFEGQDGVHVGPGGTSYCVPDGVARHREDVGPYLDKACTMPVARAPMAGPATYAMVEPNDACATAPEVHRALPPMTRRTFTRDGGGACVASGSAIVQALGELAPPDTFVSAVEAIEIRPGRIGVRVLVGSDGSRHTIGGYDLVRSEAVRVGATPNGTLRWLPARPAFVGAGEPLFADATCTVQIASKIGRTATCPLTAVIALEGLCGTGKLFALGSTLESVFRLDAKNACVAGLPAGLLAYRVGAPIEDEAFEPVVATDVGTSRVRRRGAGARGDTPVTWTDLIDGVTSEPCAVYPIADGSLRCLPAASAGVAFFADPGCSEPAFALPTGCEAGADAHFVHDSFDVATRAFEVVRPIATIYEVAATGCARFTPTVPSRLYAVKEIDVTTFALVTELVE